MAGKKLIEVALPLEAINKEAAREKSIRHGHPSTLHLWWARRPLAACRAVLFASLVDDPSSHPDRFPTEEAQEKERQRIFAIIEELVKWENSNDERVLNAAKAEIARSLAWARGEEPPEEPAAVQAYITTYAPPVLDPFCGGGSIPLEAQRLGLEAHASDLNPVAVLITKALIEIPPKFAGQPPVNPEARRKLDHSKTWRGAQGLAEDVRYYGQWMRDEAEKRIGHLYPKVKLPKEHGGGEATVIAWLWARTVRCPNPACGAQMPLVRSFALSMKEGKETWVEPVIDRTAKSVRFQIDSGKGKPPEGTVGRRGARCIVCESPVPLDHIRAEGKGGRMSAQMMAIVAEGARRRVYLPPNEQHERAAHVPVPKDAPDTDMPAQALGFRVQGYGMTKHRHLFTPRQLVALTTFSNLVSGARDRMLDDVGGLGEAHTREALVEGGSGAAARADAVATYLALGVSKLADYSSALVVWSPTRDQAKTTFARQALAMVWDSAEVNPFAGAAGDLAVSLRGMVEALEALGPGPDGVALQQDAIQVPWEGGQLFSTDPPYYDNVPYADLSDFFYVWLRRSLAPVFPAVC
ncbi:MAG TPA: DUF1156 domain-containing protein, partial [Vicinamibacteria bacterium]|nr:DUF1156 domain-containing protein [Vicinamibacteria bacterium]